MGLKDAWHRFTQLVSPDHLTPRQVAVRSRIAFAFLVLVLAGVLRWNTVTEHHQLQFQHHQHVVDQTTNRKLEDANRHLGQLADRLKSEAASISRGLQFVRFDACVKRNEFRDRIVFIVAGTPGITSADVSTIRSELGYEKCAPPTTTTTTVPRALPHVATTTSTTTTTTTTTTTRPPVTTTTLRDRDHRHRHH